MHDGPYRARCERAPASAEPAQPIEPPYFAPMLGGLALGILASDAADGSALGVATLAALLVASLAITSACASLRARPRRRLDRDRRAGEISRRRERTW